VPECPWYAEKAEQSPEPPAAAVVDEPPAAVVDEPAAPVVVDEAALELLLFVLDPQAASTAANASGTTTTARLLRMVRFVGIDFMNPPLGHPDEHLM
jgi:hypothetical protein